MKKSLQRIVLARRTAADAGAMVTGPGFLFCDLRHVGEPEHGTPPSKGAFGHTAGLRTRYDSRLFRTCRARIGRGENTSLP
jgi:hypothetical protein